MKIVDLTYSNGSFIAVGHYNKKGDVMSLRPLILVSQDKGETWSLKNVSGSKYHNVGSITAISCSNNTCATGGRGIGINMPTLIISHDYGQSWAYSYDVSGLTKGIDISAMQCTSKDCIAVGTYLKDSGQDSTYTYPALLVSKDQGKSWATVYDILNAPRYMMNLMFSSISNSA